MSLSRPYIRLARPEDKATILRFTEHTWEFGDYIADVWEKWLKEPGGKLLVATVHRQPVALLHVVMAAPGEAWLEGLRVDPDYRRAGLAARLTGYGIREAPKLGARIVRFATSSLNAPIHHLAEKLGFTRLCSIQVFRAEAIVNGASPLSSPSIHDLPLFQRFLEESTMLKAMGGLFGTGWRFHKLTLQQLGKKIDAGMVRLIRNSSGISALAILENGYSGEDLIISYADGGPATLLELANGLRKEPNKWHVRLISVRLPELPEIRAIFQKAGYQPADDHPFWLYEKKL